MEGEEGEFKVKKILDLKRIDGQTKYLVKWKGYPHLEDTWEPKEHLTNYKKKL